MRSKSRVLAILLLFLGACAGAPDIDQVEKDGGTPPPPPTDSGTPGPVSETDLTFRMMNQTRFDRFGGDPQLASLINSFLRMPISGMDGTPMLSFPEKTRTTTFPFRSDVYGGSGVENADKGTWYYRDKTSSSLEVDSFSVDATGTISVMGIPSFSLAFAGQMLTIRDITIAGKMYSSGNISGIENFTLSGCLPDADFQRVLATAGPTASVVAPLAIMDCTIDNAAQPNAYQVIVVTQPDTVILEPETI